MKYKLVETELDVPEYSYSEQFNTHEEAYERMRQMYHDLIKDGDGGPIVGGGIYENSAYVDMVDNNTIFWDIYELP